MFIPVGDAPNPPRPFIAWVNWTILALNVAIYCFISLPLSFEGVDPRDPTFQQYVHTISDTLPSTVTLREIVDSTSAYDLFVFTHGYKPGAPSWIDLLFSLFLHGGFLHLVGNMLFLWIYGDNVEYRLGRWGYLLTYLLTGVIATLIFSVFAGASLLPLVGASGAISGILGLYFLLFPRNRVKVFVALFPFFFDVIYLPARWVLGFFVLVDNVLPFVIGAESNVAYGAHLGGFIAGLGVAWMGERWAWRWPWSEPHWRPGQAMPDPPDTPAKTSEEDGVSGLRRALQQGDKTRALKLLTQMSGADIARLTPGECVSLSRDLKDAGHPIAATRLLHYCIASRPTSQGLAEVYLALGLMRLEQGQPTAAYQYLLSVLDHDPDPLTAARARQALGQIDHSRWRA